MSADKIFQMSVHKKLLTRYWSCTNVRGSCSVSLSLPTCFMLLTHKSVCHLRITGVTHPKSQWWSRIESRGSPELQLNDLANGRLTSCAVFGQVWDHVV